MSDLEARIAALERMVSQLLRRQAATIAFARSTAAPNDTGAVQTVQGQMDALSLRDGMPVLMNYGFSSVMPVGGDKVIGYLNGDRSSPVVIATGHQAYRPTGLATGESTMYDAWGRIMKLSSAGPLINGNGAPTVIQGDLHVSGAVIAGYGGADQVGLQTHRHGGVGTGSGSSGAPTAGS